MQTLDSFSLKKTSASAKSVNDDEWGEFTNFVYPLQETIFKFLESTSATDRLKLREKISKLSLVASSFPLTSISRKDDSTNKLKKEINHS